MKALVFIAAFACVSSTASAALADDKAPSDKMTISECLQVLAGLSALDYVGEQLGARNAAIAGKSTTPPGAKSYLLGTTRMTIALNIAALSRVADAIQQTTAELQKENTGSPEDFQKAWMEAVTKPCPVTLIHIKQSDLHLGDGDKENQIPPGVLSVIVPIIDP